MKKWLRSFILGLTIAGVLTGIVAVAVMAADPTGTPTGAPKQDGSCGGGNVWRQGGIDEAVTNLLGMTDDQIREQRQSGKSLVQIAADKGISEETLVNTIMAVRQETLKTQVANGVLTQEQADRMFSQMKERVALAVNRTTVGPPEWTGNNGQSGDQENCTGTPGTCNGAGKMMRGGRTGR
jgi:hypothetical protein